MSDNAGCRLVDLTPEPIGADCRHCGTSDWDCLDGINRVNGFRCCWMCGLTDAHPALQDSDSR